MRKVLPLAAVAALISISSNAQQLVIEPQVGIQTFKNNVSSTSPFQGYKSYTNPSLVFGAKFSYFSEKGHGPYFGFRAGNLSIGSFENSATHTAAFLFRRYEAGYQWMTKPVYFKNLWNNNLSSDEFHKMSNKGLGVQFMPSFGLTYSSMARSNDTYTIGSAVYNDRAYRPNFGIAAGLGLKFVHNNRHIFTLNVNYNKGFNNLYSSNFNSGSHSSFQTTRGSGFSFSVGIPLLVFKKKN